jgi:hypothetical protein
MADILDQTESWWHFCLHLLETMTVASADASEAGNAYAISALPLSLNG